MCQPTHFDSFSAAINSVRSASTIEELNSLVDRIDAEYVADLLQMTPENWGMLASETLLRSDQISFAEKTVR